MYKLLEVVTATLLILHCFFVFGVDFAVNLTKAVKIYDK